jgi:DNA-binding FadR family transcriptional regulator
VAAKSGSHDSHVRILDAVTAGDAAGAETRLLTHLTEMEGWLREHRVDQPAAQLPVRPTRPVGDHPKLGEVVADRIHHDIAVHGWPVGEVLGSETGLLQRYGVSRAVLREAVRLLEHHGVARMRRGPGGGLVIGAPDPTASIHTMALYLDHQAVGADDLRTVREAIELGCIRAVTAARPADAEERLRAAIDLAVEDGGSRDLFHTELAELAANPVLILFLQIITDLWGRHSESRRPLAPALTEEVRWIHQRILDAVRGGDEGLAQHRMRRHLQALTAWWH